MPATFKSPGGLLISARILVDMGSITKFFYEGVLEKKLKLEVLHCKKNSLNCRQFSEFFFQCELIQKPSIVIPQFQPPRLASCSQFFPRGSGVTRCGGIISFQVSNVIKDQVSTPYPIVLEMFYHIFPL